MKDKFFFLFLVLTLISCKKSYEDYTLKYDQLPEDVKNVFDDIFNTVASNETFIIVASTDQDMICHYKMNSKLNLTATLDLHFGDSKITVPFELTAVRIYVYSLGNIYYIKRSGFSKLEGGRLDEFLDYKEQIYSILKVSKL